MPLLKLSVVEIDEESDSCSDYETAIDMSHWSMWRKVVRLETPYGLTLVIGQEEQSTSYSYIEPNFDILEETGAVVYETNSSPDEQEENSKSWVAVEIPRTPTQYDLVDFSSMERDLIEEIFFPMPVDFSDFYSIDLEPELKTRFISLASEIHSKMIGQSVSIDVSWQVIERIRAHEKILSAARLAIFEAWLHNATALAKAGLLYRNSIPDCLLSHPLVA